MADAGAEVVLDSSELAIMGFSEVLGELPRILRARRRLFSFLRTEQVDLVVPVDFPGFNAGVAGRARSLDIPVFWLIAPQVWAWGGWRLAGYRKKIDRLGTILPFEEQYFSARGLDVFPMGHPLMDDYGGGFAFEEAVNRRERRLNSQDAPLTVSLLPGSRRQELVHLLPVMKVAAQALMGHLGNREVRFIVSAAPGVDRSLIASVFDQGTEISTDPLRRILSVSDLSLICSGTASLEAALAGVPHEIVYRTGRFNYWMAKRLVRTGSIGLSNLILGRPLVREHVQEAASPLPLARDLMRWVARPNERQDFYRDVRALRQLCGQAGVWDRTAEALLSFLDDRSHDSP